MNRVERLREYLRLNPYLVPLALIVLFTGVILVLQAMMIGQLLQNSKERTDQIKAIDRHLDCMTEFFAERNRADKTIEDIDKCEIRKAKGEKTTQSKEYTPQTSPQAPQRTQSAQPSSEPSRRSSPAPRASDKSETPQEERPPEQPTESEQEITGIPLVDGILRGLGG